MLDIALIFIFLLAGVIFVYHHLLYPVLLRYLAKRRRAAGLNASKRPEPLEDDKLPTVALIIPAYNEADILVQKVANVAALDYPADRLSITFALDGCTDDSFEILTREVAALQLQGPDRHSPEIHIVNHAKNRGKISLLNDHIGKQSAQIIALNDATSMIEPQSIRQAVAHYQDDKVAVVCATYELQEAGSEGERAYWKYQTRIKVDEATIASVMGPHGAFYMMRRDLWQPLPTDTINDDFVMPMRMVADGYRAVYDLEIVATEAELTTATQEFRRRVRIGAGNMQQLLRLGQLGHPRLGWVAFLFWSGMGVRPLISFFVLLAVAATAVLALRGWLVFQVVLVLEVVLFAVAALVIRQKNRAWPKLLSWLGYLVEGHTALFLGALQIFSGGRARW